MENELEKMEQNDKNEHKRKMKKEKLLEVRWNLNY